MATTKKPVKKSSIIKMSSDNPYDRVFSCGRAKSGKTYFACTYPKPLVINTDKGLATVRDKNIPYIDIVRMTEENKNDRDVLCRYSDVLQIIKDLKYQEGKYWEEMESVGYVPETIIIDSISAMSDLMEAEIIIKPPDGKGRNEILQIQDYNLIQRRMLSIIDMCREMPYHFVATAGLDLKQDERGAFLDNPLATGAKLGPQIPHYFDEVYLHEYDRDKKKWTLTPMQSKRFPYAGTRKGLKMVTFDNPTYEDLKGAKK